MALNIPVGDVVSHYGDEPLNQVKLNHILTECGVIWNQLTHGTLVFEGWYFACVPSLNYRGGMHQILLYSEFSDGHTMRVLDPAQGLRYKEDGSDLVSWADLTPFHPGGMLPPSKAH